MFVHIDFQFDHIEFHVSHCQLINLPFGGKSRVYTNQSVAMRIVIVAGGLR
jgi:hypothetical protein